MSGSPSSADQIPEKPLQNCSTGRIDACTPWADGLVRQTPRRRSRPVFRFLPVDV